MRARLSGARLLLVGLALAGLLGTAGGVTFAAFSAATANPSNTFSADTLQAPSGLTVTWNPSVNLSWTASPSTWASGYRILRATSAAGPYTQIASVSPRTTTTYVDAPGAGTFHYRVRAYYGTTTWVSADSNTAARQDSTFVFKATSAFTGTNCSGGTRLRDLEQGFTPSSPEETLTPTGAAGVTMTFCSDVLPAQPLAGGTTTVNAWFDNARNKDCVVTATLLVNGTTSLGSGTVTVPANSALALRTWSFGTAAHTFAAGDRLDLRLAWAASNDCRDTTLHYDGAAANSRVTVPTIG
jgi:hypothetical protein